MAVKLQGVQYMRLRAQNMQYVSCPRDKTVWLNLLVNISIESLEALRHAECLKIVLVLFEDRDINQQIWKNSFVSRIHNMLCVLGPQSHKLSALELIGHMFGFNCSVPYALRIGSHSSIVICIPHSC